MRRILLLLVLLLSGLSASAQCSSKNEAFKSGETLIYDLYFNWKFVWIKVGKASMNTTQTTYGGKPAYRTYLITRGSKKADNIFVMRDTLMAYMGLDLTPKYYAKKASRAKRIVRTRCGILIPKATVASRCVTRRIRTRLRIAAIRAGTALTT